MTSIKLVVAAVAGLTALSACTREYPSTTIPEGVFEATKAAHASHEAHKNLGDVETDVFPEDSYHHFLREHRQALYFESGKSELTKDHKKALQDLVDRSERYNDFNILVVSHSDSVGDDDKNMELAKARFLEVSDFLTTKSIPASSVIARVHGEDAPAVEGDSGYRHKRNRRVEVYLVLDKSAYKPGFRITAP